MDQQSTHFEATVDGVRVSLQPPAPAAKCIALLFYKEQETNRFKTVAEEKARLLRLFGIVDNYAEYEMAIVEDTETVKEMEDDKRTWDYSEYFCNDTNVLEIKKKATGEAP